MPNWNRDQPIIRYLRVWLPRMFSVINRIGGYVPRTTRGGSFSAHSEGRAADIYLNASNSEQRAIGDGLFRIFTEYCSELGVDHVIWNLRIASRHRPTPREYTGSGGPHTNHAHVAFTRPGSQQTPPILIPLLDGIHIDVYGYLAGEPSDPQRRF
jgi:hypothetical protein